MTKISDDDVRGLANLSALLLEENEIAGLRTDLERILDYINKLQELDTDGVEPTYQVTGLANVWRDDIVTDDAVTREQLLALAPETAQNQIKVPKVL